jgi:hypothetical protein
MLHNAPFLLQWHYSRSRSSAAVVKALHICDTKSKIGTYQAAHFDLKYSANVPVSLYLRKKASI